MFALPNVSNIIPQNLTEKKGYHVNIMVIKGMKWRQCYGCMSSACFFFSFACGTWWLELDYRAWTIEDCVWRSSLFIFLRASQESFSFFSVCVLCLMCIVILTRWVAVTNFAVSWDCWILLFGQPWWLITRLPAKGCVHFALDCPAFVQGRFFKNYK